MLQHIAKPERQKFLLKVKYAPLYCAINEDKYYKYTTECTRQRYREMYNERGAPGSSDFLIKLAEKAPFPIREIG